MFFQRQYIWQQVSTTIPLEPIRMTVTHLDHEVVCLYWYFNCHNHWAIFLLKHQYIKKKSPSAILLPRYYLVCRTSWMHCIVKGSLTLAISGRHFDEKLQCRQRIDYVFTEDTECLLVAFFNRMQNMCTIISSKTKSKIFKQEITSLKINKVD